MSAVIEYYQREPARVHGYIAAAVVALAAALGLGLHVHGVESAIAVIVPIIVAELTRRKVYAPATVQEIVHDDHVAQVEPYPDDHDEVHIQDGPVR